MAMGAQADVQQESAPGSHRNKMDIFSGLLLDSGEALQHRSGGCKVEAGRRVDNNSDCNVNRNHAFLQSRAQTTHESESASATYFGYR